MEDYHIPVLLRESVEGLQIDPDGTYVDVTYGGGGHSNEILKRLNKGRLYAFDQDKDAAEALPEDQKFFFIQGNFRFLKNYLKYFGIGRIDGLLADLGVSSHHFNTPERGFTYRSDAPLDMRMNIEGKITAATVINDYDAVKLSDIFYRYGEIPQARKLSAAIVEARGKQPILTASQLIGSIKPLIPPQAENQFLSKVFQAIRIEVNNEMESLEKLLHNALEMLNPGGRLVIISYHSLEDRMVKNFMRWGNVNEQPPADIYGNSPEPFRIITRKPLTASEEEIRTNPRARSARLRIAERKHD
jgi:16S rRNA (cytosine1402-N4)-methyltransferase